MPPVNSGGSSTTQRLRVSADHSLRTGIRTLPQRIMVRARSIFGRRSDDQIKTSLQNRRVISARTDLGLGQENPSLLRRAAHKVAKRTGLSNTDIHGRDPLLKNLPSQQMLDLASDANKELGEATFERNRRQRLKRFQREELSGGGSDIRRVRNIESLAKGGANVAKVSSGGALLSASTGVGAPVGAALETTAAIGAGISVLGDTVATGMYNQKSNQLREEAILSNDPMVQDHRTLASQYMDVKAGRRLKDAGKGLVDLATEGLGDVFGAAGEAISAAAEDQIDRYRADDFSDAAKEGAFSRLAQSGEDLFDYRDKMAATTIQRVARGRIQRKRYAEEFALKSEAATKIQAVVRGHQARKSAASLRESKRNNAATKIQAAFRGHQGRQEARDLREQKAIAEFRDAFSKNSGSKTLGARVNEFFGRKSTHTKIMESMDAAMAAGGNKDSRRDALMRAQKLSQEWLSKRSSTSKRSEATTTLSQSLTKLPYLK